MGLCVWRRIRSFVIFLLLIGVCCSFYLALIISWVISWVRSVSTYVSACWVFLANFVLGLFLAGISIIGVGFLVIVREVGIGIEYDWGV